MKKLILVLGVFISLFLFTAKAYADSPLTSTPFSSAYADITIVKEAAEKGKVDTSIAQYLAEPSNPIDVKAAVINALSWDFNGKTNASYYCSIIYHKSLEELDISALSGDQQFCIGYMMAMDNYFETERALEYLKLAEKNLPGSITVSMVRALVEAMSLNRGTEWDGVQKVLMNPGLKQDMRQDALNIILDYMALYSNDPELEISRNHVLIENGTSQNIYLYGTYYLQGEMPYQVTESSDIAYAAIVLDQYNISCLKVTGVRNGSSAIRVTSIDGKTADISFDVVSEETYKKLNNTVILFNGSNVIYTGRQKTVMAKAARPFIRNEKQYIPVENTMKAVGGSVKFDRKTGSSTITYGSKSIVITTGSNIAKVNGKTTKLRAYIETKSGVQFISVQDFISLTNKKFISDNGLIFIAAKSMKFNTVTEDYILGEIENLFQDKKLIESVPQLFYEDGLYGYKDISGKVIIEPKFTWAGEFSEGLAAAAIMDPVLGERYGFIDPTGNYVIEPIYQKADAFVGGLAPVFQDWKAGFIDKKGNVVIPMIYSGAGCFSEGLAAVFDPEGKGWGFLDPKGNLVIPYRYSDCTGFREGLSGVEIDDVWGYIDKTGKLVLPCIYDSATIFLEGTAYVGLNDKYYEMNKAGAFYFLYENGDIYVGEQLDGYANGIGVYTWANGTQYSGEMQLSCITGYGTLTNPGMPAQEGYWEDGIFIGASKPSGVNVSY